MGRGSKRWPPLSHTALHTANEGRLANLILGYRVHPGNVGFWRVTDKKEEGLRPWLVDSAMPRPVRFRR